MNILYCGDNGAEKGILLSCLSLCRNTEEPLHIYILTATLETKGICCNGLNKAFAKGLEERLNEKNSESFVEVLDISDLFASELPLANLGTRFTPCCMLRLFADKVPDIPDKILYLDADVICVSDFAPFYNTDIEKNEIAGVLDYYGSHFFRKNIFKRDYINSGVLLLNMELIRKTKLFAKCRKMCESKKMFMPDQSALNKLCEHKKILPARFNEQKREKEDTVFRHFTTTFRFFPFIRTVSVKPWEKEKMHSILKNYRYDSLLNEYEELLKEKVK